MRDRGLQIALRRGFFLLLLIVGSLLAPPEARAGDGPSRNELSKAEHFVQKLERQVEIHRGKPFNLSYDAKQALKRVRKLKEAYPDDAQVEALFQRVRNAVKASKGETFQITPEMLAYRENEKRLARKLSEMNVAAWKRELELQRSARALIEKPFPAPDPLQTDPRMLHDKHVVLEKFEYPRNEFTDAGGQYVFAGSQAQGYYYVHLSNRAWIGVYEALKRYRREASQEIPETWQLMGRITGVALLVPQAGEEKTMSPWFGWVVEPVALYAPGVVCTRVDPEHERGGTYEGEEQLESLKASMYTYREVPADVEPLELLRIFAAAIKEKNWKLYLACIDPARRATPTAIARLRYFYDNNQERYHRYYVHVEPQEVVSLVAIRGWKDEKGSDEDFFLDKEDKEEIEKHAEPLVEEARVTIKTYDERGRQVSLPNTIVLRRYEKKQWYVYSGFPL